MDNATHTYYNTMKYNEFGDVFTYSILIHECKKCSFPCSTLDFSVFSLNSLLEHFKNITLKSSTSRREELEHTSLECTQSKCHKYVIHKYKYNWPIFIFLHYKSSTGAIIGIALAGSVLLMASLLLCILHLPCCKDAYKIQTGNGNRRNIRPSSTSSHAAFASKSTRQFLKYQLHFYKTRVSVNEIVWNINFNGTWLLCKNSRYGASWQLKKYWRTLCC